MNFCGRRFNLYLLALTLALLATGCTLLQHKPKETAALRIHIESEASSAGTGHNISVLRAQPVSISIIDEPIITEANVISARLIDAADGSFSLEIKLNQSGSWALEQYTSINPGKHLVIFGQWSSKVSDGRWLAAPLIFRRMAGGTLVFTPDASHEEIEKFVEGLNRIAKKNTSQK